VHRVTRKIAEIRRAKGLTQEDLAGVLRTAVRNVQRIESGQNLTLFTLAKIAHALGVPPEELMQTSGAAYQAVAESPDKIYSSKPQRKRRTRRRK